MKKALLVGINKYPDPRNELHGCINDITDMAAFITKQRQFASPDVRLLSDARATKANIMERLEWLTQGAKAGDQLLFHYSGHGAQMATRSKSGELDGLDEVICPYDFDWSDATALKDKEFAKIFSGLPKGADFIWISDSCHSQDLSRGIKKPVKGIFKVRTMIPPPDIAWRNMSISRTNVTLNELAKTAKEKNLALISGCKSTQESADAVFNKKANGALSYFLLKSLNAKTGKTTSLSELVAIINKSLRKVKYPQEPQIEGSTALMGANFF
ncbi:MAG: caspase family protein, partial [Chitinophagaceae bacterium]